MRAANAILLRLAWPRVVVVAATTRAADGVTWVVVAGVLRGGGGLARR
jgi:hypothetical protein